jgi:hypothetical protein
VALLSVAVKDVDFVFLEALRGIPFFLGQIYRARHIAFGEIIRCPHIHHVDVLIFVLQHPIQFHRPGGKGIF